MPTISMFYGILIRMYWNDHAPPHFHVEYGEYRAQYLIETLVLSRGQLPRRARSGIGMGRHAPQRIDGGLGTMRIEAATQDDFAFGLNPCAPDVTSVKVIEHLNLRVEFADGLVGTVRFEPSHLSGVFEALRDPDFFAQVTVSHGTVAWPGELDMAPDAMYDAIQQHQEWVLQ